MSVVPTMMKPRPERNATPKLIYAMAVSLDGYMVGPDGRHDWSAPDQGLHRFHNEQSRQIQARLMGRGCTRTCFPGRRRSSMG